MSSRAAHEAHNTDEDHVGNDGPYRLQRIQFLSEHGREQPLGQITCAEFWDGNLYVGTSSTEIFHYFLIPIDPIAEDQQQTFIFASRRVIQPQEDGSAPAEGPGVQQILVLPGAGKACILCNGTLTFYSLPELTPAFQSTKSITCAWVGGVDQNTVQDDAGDDGVVIMICQRSHIRLVKISERPQKIRDIELGGCTVIARRGDIACAADSDSYYLLDIVEQRKMPLSGICSVSEGGDGTQVDTEPGSTKGRDATSASLRLEAASSGTNVRTSPDPGHTRSSSLNLSSGTSTASAQDRTSRRRASQSSEPNLSPFPPRNSSLASTSSRTGGTEGSPTANPVDNKSTGEISPPSAGAVGQADAARKLTRTHVPLKPHVASPNLEEFFVTTGTSYDEPGLGMFVNLEGEASGTIEFSCYPDAIAFDGFVADPNLDYSSTRVVEGNFLLALVRKTSDTTSPKRLEIQRWDDDRSEPRRDKSWLDIPFDELEREATTIEQRNATLRVAMTYCVMPMPEVDAKLALDRVKLIHNSNGTHLELPRDEERRRSELSFVRQMSTGTAKILVSTQDRLWWVVRNPEFVQLDFQLHDALRRAPNGHYVDRRLVEWIWNELRGQDPQPGVAYLGVKYIRQKAALLLFMDLIFQAHSGSHSSEQDRKVTEEALAEGELDPRIVLAVLPRLCQEVVEGGGGIWLPSGIKGLVEAFLSLEHLRKGSHLDQSFDEGILNLVKRYLQLWRNKKGFGSISDEKEVFESVDGALIHVLLLLDCTTASGPAVKGSVRSELNAVVDHGVDCFDHVVDLLEGFQRLYVLSRLYHCQNMPGQVLSVMRRIISGEQDLGGEFIDGEKRFRKYLRDVDSADLVEEYGTWLASRNPRLGVQVFADRSSKIRFEPKEVVELLKRKAPRAVKDFLEHLVFDKNLAQHANDLINYYLDSVLAELDTSETARTALLGSYKSYRALRAPKPTYSQFATDSALDADWWRNRLRLLQLLGGSHGPASQYDLPWILARVESYERELVPEMIILNGRRGRHKEALRLLTQGLGDFDTAVSYCVLGGASTYSPTAGYVPEESVPSRHEQAALFGYLLEEFFRIEDEHDRITQTSELLERFAGWFDVSHVLAVVPDSWSVDQLSRFLTSALRQLVAERNETAVTKALTNAVNLNTSAEAVEKLESFGPTIVRDGARTELSQ